MGIGIWQLLLILIIIFVVFGAGKLPKVMKDVGKGVRNLKEGLDGDEDEVKKKDKNMKDITPSDDEKK